MTGQEPQYVQRLTGATFNCEDGGFALVVNKPTEKIDALIFMLVGGFGGRWSRDNPVLVEAAEQVKVEVWRSTTKGWREAEGVDDEYVTDWCAPHGDGARQVLVAYYPTDVYDLGERAAAAEVTV